MTQFLLGAGGNPEQHVSPWGTTIIKFLKNNKNNLIQYRDNPKKYDEMVKLLENFIQTKKQQ